MGSLGGVRSIHECLCLYARTMLVPFAQCFGMDSLGDAPFYVHPRTWACTQMDSLGDAPIVLRPACSGSDAVFVHAQFMAYIVWVMHRLCLGPDPFNDWGGGDVTNLSPFWEGTARK